MRRQRWDSPRDLERKLRASQTDAEELLWNMVRSRRLGGLKFRRQHRFGDYILDFYSPDLGLAIELDGKHHFTEVGQKADELRTRYLNEQGITVIRFENQEVLANPDIVSDAVLTFRQPEMVAPHPDPLPVIGRGPNEIAGGERENELEWSLTTDD